MNITIVCAYVFIIKHESVIAQKGAYHKRKNHIVTLFEKREAWHATTYIL